MEKIQKWVELKTEISKYLPEYESDKDLNQDWYCNVVINKDIYMIVNTL